MPEISKFYGIIIYMYIDDHNPPHFHVWYDDYQAEITIKDGVVTGSLPRRALRLVYEWLDLHRDELMENWERLSNSEAAKKMGWTVERKKAAKPRLYDPETGDYLNDATMKVIENARKGKDVIEVGSMDDYLKLVNNL